jgi:hypothetical protein
MGNFNTKPRMNEENRQQHGGQLAKAPKPPITDLPSALASMTTLVGAGTFSSPFKVDNKLTAMEDTAILKYKVKIDAISYDIIIRIFNELSLCSKTCLGVTCKILYEILKKQHPGPISLSQMFKEDEVIAAHLVASNGRWSRIRGDNSLGWYLQDWSGFAAGYRLLNVDYGCLVFVNTNVYGPHKHRKDNTKAKALQKVLERRYSDYRLSVRTSRFWNSKFYSQFGVVDRILPHPFNKGESYDEEVLALAEASAANRRDLVELGRWGYYWAMFRIWKDRREDFIRIQKNATERIGKS